MNETKEMYAIIGAGPCGLAAIRCLSKNNIPFKAFEYHDSVGGIWNSQNPLSTMYNSAHLISSKTKTQYTEYDFDEKVADFPHNKKIRDYFLGFSKEFDLDKHIRFNSAIQDVSRNDDRTWTVTYKDTQTDNQFSEIYKGVILATGLFNKGNENIPKWEGSDRFKGQIIHAADYKSNDTFADKRVLVVGCGNSAADIAIDAVHRAKFVDMSVRRGYYFVPKYIFGKPMDTIKSGIQKYIPGKIKRKIDKQILKWFAGDAVAFGFPKPDYDLYESHPVVNSYLLQHIGHGDIDIVKDIVKMDGNTVYFKDGEQKDYDVILTATGYHIKFKYIDHELLNWKNDCPDLHLNIFHPEYDNLFVAGMVEATGIGWQGRYDQAELIANYIVQKESGKNTSEFQAFEKERKENTTDLSAGTKYIKLARMAYYVDKERYLDLIQSDIESLSM